MRGGVRRAPVAGLVTVVLAVGLAACTGDKGEDDKPEAKESPSVRVAKACEGGTFTWSNVEQPTRLTGVSRAERQGDGGGKLTSKLRRLYTPEVSVQAEGPSLDSADVLFSLGKEIGYIDPGARSLDEDSVESAFVTVGLKAPVLNDGSLSLSADSAGEYVGYAYVKEAAGDFRYSCPGGEATTGHAKSWKVDGEGGLKCDEAAGSDAARQAALLSCAKDSAAAKDALRAGAKAPVDS
ncbi:hypothetical protein WBG99_11710 [Streptomyces sp. TG1A-60]|uniref:hypothetical protein n=1 Tax=Streptomyces sp. TG1A-60 TaxID=3129111 RepID=UPI0030CF1F0B